MELKDRRKSIRLTMVNSWVVIQNQKYEVLNLSPEGIRIQGQFPGLDRLNGELWLNGQSLGRVLLQVVNQQNQTVGAVILNEPLKNNIQPWFNPLKLVQQLQPQYFNDQLTYEDQNNNCSFKFFFDNLKKITKVAIELQADKIEWTENGWQTYSQHRPDLILDTHKIKLVQKMVQEGQTFPQSFKDWLLELS